MNVWTLITFVGASQSPVELLVRFQYAFGAGVSGSFDAPVAQSTNPRKIVNDGIDALVAYLNTTYGTTFTASDVVMLP